MNKFVRIVGNDVYLGRIYSDNSRNEFIRLFVDKDNIFQMEFLHGTNEAYAFLPECTELFNILSEGIVGIKVKDIGIAMKEHGYIQIS